jgi:hypothetical protein
VFASADSGGTWTDANAGADIPGVSALTLDPTGTLMYAGTGASGVFRSGTLPSTTTTTMMRTSTTSTTLPNHPAGACALGCDDGDPCTIDTCTAGTCRHDPATGFDAARCILMPTALPFDACGGVIPSALARRIDRARSLVDHAAQMTPRRARASLMRAVRLLHATRRLELAAERRGEISVDCATALGRLLAEAAARAHGLVGVARPA